MIPPQAWLPGPDLGWLIPVLIIGWFFIRQVYIDYWRDRDD